MSNVSVHHNIIMNHDIDPREILLKELGDISGLKLANTQFMIAIYIRPEKTKSGLFMPEQARNEDRYQSKMGLIIKMGPSAFKDDTGKWFEGLDIKVGDWISHRPSDGWNITIRGVLCRMMDDSAFKMLVPDELLDSVY